MSGSLLRVVVFLLGPIAWFLAYKGKQWTQAAPGVGGLFGLLTDWMPEPLWRLAYVVLGVGIMYIAAADI